MSAAGLTKFEKIELGLNLVSLAIDVADKLVVALKDWGVIKTTTTAEELGAKSLEAERNGIRAEDAKDFGGYLQAVDAIELTPEQASAYDPKACEQRGKELALRGLGQELGNEAGAFTQELAKNEDFYRADGRLETYADAVRTGELAAVDISAYFDNKLDDLQSIKKTDAVLQNVEERRGLSPEEAAKELDAEIEKRAGR
ncbi:MAG: hypothetical protein MR711_05395 [Selenomonas sp.]|uniref:hypothetical protein n=1 Tax=Selenomonas sp. TaxID=2053611 RepID=UPI0025D70A23|nr:hypothetical protein [Selenomonas sp.]MCI6085675.1 hypothetical protein [Selenomonas sp.]MDY4414976.1 hypothetical protein [Selenomonas sp.]